MVRIEGLIASGLVTGLSLWILSELSPHLEFTTLASLVFAVIAVGIANAFIAPAIAFVAVPISTLTLGIGALFIDGLLIAGALKVVPGVEVDAGFNIIFLALGMAAISLVINSIVTINDDARFDSPFRRQIKRHPLAVGERRTVMIQIDGLGYDVLKRATRNGNAPTIEKMIRSGSHKLAQWQTDWSSQTGASQRGILMGSNDNMPAFRWYERSTGNTIVSNRPASAKYLEDLCDKREGLLFDNGASINNIFSGGAVHSILTMSSIGKKKGRIGQGYAAYFSQPYNSARTSVRFIAELFREVRSSWIASHREIYPSIKRPLSYAFARAGTTVVLQDVSLNSVLGEMASGRRSIYVDFVGYDEVAHHVGPERAESLDALRQIDECVRRIDRFARFAGYNVVLLSDHGQSQGETFLDEYGESLGDVISRLTKQEVAELRETKDEHKGGEPPTDTGKAVEVLASGNLGLVYFKQFSARPTREQLEAEFPQLIDELVEHPGVAFCLVATDKGGVVIGKDGEINIETEEITGANPLEQFGQHALRRVRRSNGFADVADLMVNASWNRETDATGAFEQLVGSHGGMGGEQSGPFILVPSEFGPTEEIFGAENVHKLLKQVIAQPTAG